MNFFEAIKVCFIKYATFSGRARRSEFWYFILFYTLGTLVTFLLGGVGFLIFYVLTIVPYFAVWIRRLHDINRSGWWTIPIGITSMIVVGAIWFIIWGCKKSVTDNNKY
jgi:uncharacterized membrane protein YhaH (DUF805 family)